MSHDQQAQRLREIDDLLAECQRHAMPGVRVSYAQLRALRDAIAAPVPPAAVAVPDVLCLDRIGIACLAEELIGTAADGWGCVNTEELVGAIIEAYFKVHPIPAPVAQKFVAAVVRDVREDDGGWIQEIATEGVKLDYGTLLYVAAPVAPKVPDDVARDAARYAYLRDHMQERTDGITCIPGLMVLPDGKTFADRLDTYVDTAMLAAAQAQEGKP